MFVSFDTKVRYKGREYSTLDEIPPDIRGPLNRALQRLAPSGVVTPHLPSRILLDGRTIADPNALSAAERRAIDNFLHALLPIDTAICVAAARERKHVIRGVVGLSLLLVGCVAAAVVLWSRGYLFWLN